MSGMTCLEQRPHLTIDRQRAGGATTGEAAPQPNKGTLPLSAVAGGGRAPFCAGSARPMTRRGGIAIGVDIGGTFTDVVVSSPGTPMRIMKLPSTRKDPSVAVLKALQRMQADWGLALEQVRRFV